ncbi:MAG TPA: hypothetical protein VGL34_05940 [Steroidobacteraceae bacterium]
MQRSPLLERLIARASTPARVADWRAEAFRVIAPEEGVMPPIAATALNAGTAAGAWVCIATAVHFSAGMSNVTMPADGIVELDNAEAETLATDFNRVFAGAGMRLRVSRGAVLLCVFDQRLEVTTHDPEAAGGHDVFDFQPAGADAPRLRRLMSEMEMWLFDHEVNRARAAHARQVITGLWLWGGGATGSTRPTVHGWTAGQDVFFAAFGQEARFPSEAGAGVVACVDQPGSSAWPAVEQRWLAPALTALKSGRIAGLDLSAGNWRFSLRRAPNWRFWRRPRPWWESFGMIDESDGIQ